MNEYQDVFAFRNALESYTINLKKRIRELENQMDTNCNLLENSSFFTHIKGDWDGSNFKRNLHLKIDYKAGKPYYRIGNSCHGKSKFVYIPKSQAELIKTVAINDYARHVLNPLRQNLNLAEKMCADFNWIRERDFADGFNKNKMSLCKGFAVPTTEEVISEFYRTHTTAANQPYPQGLIFKTSRGDKVRSKSEIFISDRLSKTVNPFVYECPLAGKNGLILYPDFTILNLKTMQIIYWEHFGRMADERYIKKFVKHMNDYADIGIYPGINMICSFEDDENPLTIDRIDALIKQYL